MINVPRRIVTGHDEAGRSVVLSDGPAPNSHEVSPGASFHEIWATTGAPAPIVATEDEPTESAASVPPPAQGTRLRIVDFPPSGQSPMHRTETVDYGIVLAGRIQLVLDDGSETMLEVGDVVIQRGTDHRWVNAAEEISTMAFFLVDAKFADELLETLPADVLGKLMDRA